MQSQGIEVGLSAQPIFPVFLLVRLPPMDHQHQLRRDSGKLTCLLGLKKYGPTAQSAESIYEIGDQHVPHYLQISSIKKIGDRAIARTKMFFDPAKPKTFYGKTFPEAVYQEQVLVYDCTTPTAASTEDFIFSGTGELLFHYKWGDPKYLDIAAIGFAVHSGSPDETRPT